MNRLGWTIIFFEFKYEFRLDLLDSRNVDIFEPREWHDMTSIWEYYFGCNIQMEEPGVKEIGGSLLP